jgi:hypothetical protein
LAEILGIVEMDEPMSAASTAAIRISTTWARTKVLWLALKSGQQAMLFMRKLRRQMLMGKRFRAVNVYTILSRQASKNTIVMTDYFSGYNILYKTWKHK